MAQNLAEQLIRRLATDTAFRDALRALDPVGRRVFLDANGFQGVSPEWIQSVAHTTFKALTSGKGSIAEADAMEAITAAATNAVAAHWTVTNGAAPHWTITNAPGPHWTVTNGAAAHWTVTNAAAAPHWTVTNGVAAHWTVTNAAATHWTVTNAPASPEPAPPAVKDDSSKS